MVSRLSHSNSAMPEVVGSAGLLVDPDSWQSIAHAMKTLI